MIGPDLVEIYRHSDKSYYASKVDDLLGAVLSEQSVDLQTLLTKTVRFVLMEMSFSVQEVEKIKSSREPGTFIPLQVFVNHKVGVCLHMTLYLSILISEAIKKIKDLPHLDISLSFVAAEVTGEYAHHLRLSVTSGNTCYEIDPSKIATRITPNLTPEQILHLVSITIEESAVEL